MKRKMDAGHRETEAVLKQIERRIQREYAQAEHEVRLKLEDYLTKFEAKDALKRKALEKGLISQYEYDQWRIGQIMVGQRWTMMANSLAVDYANASLRAKQIAFGEMPKVYAINFNYGMYATDVMSGGIIADSFVLYNQDAVAHLFKDGEFYHGPGKRITNAINMGKQVAWDKKQIQSVMMQSLLQGESISKIATRLSVAVGDGDRKASIRNARTMTTGVQNAGRVDSFRRSNSIAEKYGMKVRKQWIATLDGRTRHWHAELDGEIVDNDEPFENDFGEIQFPGDPSAHPANIYNCRCSCIPVIEGAGLNNSLHPKDTGREIDEELDISYEEWKAGHYKQKSDSITKQEEIGEAMREAYGAEYRSYFSIPDAVLGADYGIEGIPFVKPHHVTDIDFNDSSAVKSLIDDFETWAVDQDVEHMIIISPTGEVYYAVGGKEGMILDGMDDKLKGAIVAHNHPIDVTLYSFAGNDRTFFGNTGVSELYGADKKYKYRMSRKLTHIDELPAGIPNSEDVEHCYNILYANEFGYGYRRILNE